MTTITVDDLLTQIKYVDKTEAFRRILAVTDLTPPASTKTTDDDCFSGHLVKLIEPVSADRRVEALKHLNSVMQDPWSIKPSMLQSIMNKFREDDGLRVLSILEKRISTQSSWLEMGKVLDRICERDRLKAVEILKAIISTENSERLSIDDIATLTRRTPNFALSFVVVVKNWISTSLDFTRSRQVLETSTDKNARLEILGELVGVSPNSPASLMCSDVRSIISTLPQWVAFKGLKLIQHLLHPQIDLRRVELVFECIMKTDEVKALRVLLGRPEDEGEDEGQQGQGIAIASGSFTALSLNDVKMIIEKMAEPYKGLEAVKERIDPAIELNKVASVINVIPPIKRIAALSLLLDVASASNECRLSAFEMRSVLMLMEANTGIEALRMLLTRFERSSERDTDRVLECFSEATRPLAAAILFN